MRCTCSTSLDMLRCTGWNNYGVAVRRGGVDYKAQVIFAASEIIARGGNEVTRIVEMYATNSTECGGIGSAQR